MKNDIFLFEIALCLKLLSAFMLQNFLTYLSQILAIAAIIFVVYQLLHKKIRLTLKKCVLIICLLSVVTIPTQTMTIGKFYLFKPLYQQSAELIVENIDGQSSAYNYKSQVSIPKRFLLNNCEKNVECRISDEYYAISFTKHRNFFQLFSYVYFSEPEAIELVTTPGRYWVGHDNANAYDTIIWLEQDKWALVKYY